MSTAPGLVIATSGIPDESCVFLDGKTFHHISSINTHYKPATSEAPRSMVKFVGSPYFGDEVHSFEEILERYDLVFSLGSGNGSDRLFYKKQPLGFISELYLGISSQYGVIVEMNVVAQVLEIYKERFKLVPWITFEVVNSVEFTNA